ncbi:hypothetical protein QFZ21_000473 [Microbacterium sp. W4I20]|nr:hypothetical protein [Microbacterium sp. W4I20]
MPLRLVELEVEAQFGAQIGLGDLVDRVDRLQSGERVERRPRRRGDLLVSGGAQVAEAVVDLVAPDVRAEGGSEDSDRIDPVIGDLVDGGGSAGS